MKKYLILIVFTVVSLGTVILISQINAVEPEQASRVVPSRLFDSNGQYIGYLLNAQFSGNPPTSLNYSVYRNDLGMDGVVFGVGESAENNVGVSKVNLNWIQYTEVNCTGTPYENLFIPHRKNLLNAFTTTTDETISRDYVYTSSSSDFIAISQMGRGTNGCVNYNEPIPVYGYRLREIVLPFTEPFALPLKIR